jgi:CubicO group peptidase (beta-lactamase class C family)
MPSWTNLFEAFAARLVEEQDIPGLALMLAEGGQPAYFKGFGQRDRAAGLPVTEHTLFGIGSITKSFTAVAIMQLQEAGRLSVEDPLGRHVPELDIAGMKGANPIRLSHLLAHTSGMPPSPALNATLVRSLRADPDVPEAVRSALPPAVDDFSELVAYLNALKAEPLAEPGRLFSYWNDGWALLGLVIERVSGESYESYVRRHILEPAGMSESTFDVGPRADGPDTTRLYNRRKGEGDKDESYEAGPWWDAPPMTAAGFLRSTAYDMLRYLEIYRTGGKVGESTILSPESVGEMTRPRVWCNPGMSYGYGLMLTPDYHGVALVEHGGGIKGVSAWVTVVPERGITAVGLANVGGAPTSRVLLGAVNAALGLAPETPRLAFGAYSATAPFADYEGVYASGEDARGEDSTVTVSAAPDLSIAARGERFALRPADRDGFVLTAHGDDAYIRFLRDEAGQVWAMAYGYRIVRRVGPR